MTNLSIEDRKALLATRSEVERMKIALSLHELRNMLLPVQSLDPSDRNEVRGIAARLLLTALGKSKVLRLKQGATVMLMLWRLWRRWGRR